MEMSRGACPIAGMEFQWVDIDFSIQKKIWRKLPRAPRAGIFTSRSFSFLVLFIISYILVLSRTVIRAAKISIPVYLFIFYLILDMVSFRGY